MKKKATLIAAAMITALSVAACDTAQETATLAAIQGDCVNAVQGTTVFIGIASSLAGAPAITPLVTTIGSNATVLCGGVEYAAKAIIDAITAAGGTATVTVSTAAPGGTMSVKRRLAFRRGVMTDLVTKKIYVVPPGF